MQESVLKKELIRLYNYS